MFVKKRLRPGEPVRLEMESDAIPTAKRLPAASKFDWLLPFPK